MERPRPRHEGGEHHHDKHEFAPEERIELGITAAIAGDLVIDDHTARAIAARLGSIKTPMLDLFTHTGHMDAEGFKELRAMRLDPPTSEQQAHWIDWLGGYWLSVEQQRATDAERHPTYEQRVYVADLDSLRRTIHHGLWVDANQAPADLKADVTAMLDSSPTVGATRWAVGAAKDLAGLDLTGSSDTALISRLARGVHQHGAAYSAWASIAGTDDHDQLDKFANFHVASYDSREAWMRDIADDLGWANHLDRAVDPMLRPFLRIDYEAMAESPLTERWDVVRGHDRRIHVFLR
ncbi:antirestriction protein ArdA [Umezawaea sp. Da 62-37]|uniref:antirestriction protein ArdA n=1 Tax=Umezawaea sp. Da 62-37 TaxID=3075927 RepID=UPI0028F729DD|nr:antirestriction protein ArdA [Umezawaea sp. Da 62-37]WNV83466.1 antirestriction protein ArdA [Umezawaea sp. Da 62-37]